VTHETGETVVMVETAVTHEIAVKVETAVTHR